MTPPAKKTSWFPDADVLLDSPVDSLLIRCSWKIMFQSLVLPRARRNAVFPLGSGAEEF